MSVVKLTIMLTAMPHVATPTTMPHVAIPMATPKALPTTKPKVTPTTTSITMLYNYAHGYTPRLLSQTTFMVVCTPKI
jgi:hypothetical protein